MHRSKNRAQFLEFESLKKASFVDFALLWVLLKNLLRFFLHLHNFSVVRKKLSQNVPKKKRFIPDENTRSKFLFYGGPDCVNISDGLEYYIDSGIIPDFLGGPCPVSV